VNLPNICSSHFTLAVYLNSRRITGSTLAYVDIHVYRALIGTGVREVVETELFNYRLKAGNSQLRVCILEIGLIVAVIIDKEIENS